MNADPAPSIMTFAEIKSARKGAQSMLTLFTKSPNPDEANSKLLDRYGYVTPQSAGRKILSYALSLE